MAAVPRRSSPMQASHSCPPWVLGGSRNLQVLRISARGGRTGLSTAIALLLLEQVSCERLDQYGELFR
eukprot:12078021-Heterocapsa_arctica.AAC.1